MNKKNNENLDKFLQENEEQEERARHAFTQLLDRQREKAGRLFALRAEMGVTKSYITSVPFSWVRDNILFAAALPLFEGNSDKDSKKVAINEGTVELLQQREPDWRRQRPMSVYLAERDNHKFPPMLVVCYQKWAYQERDESDNWGIDGKALKDSIPATMLDSNGCFFDIRDNGTSYYALDGQHRLMAIKGLADLIDKERIYSLGKNGKPGKSEITLGAVVDSIIERRCKQGDDNLDRTKIHSEVRERMKETIGLEIIPAVQKGETREEAVRRLRQIFVDVNEQAKPPSKGDNIMLDNSNGFRIVARQVMVAHNLLKDKTAVMQRQLAESSPLYTTLQELAAVAEKYLRQTGFLDWKIPTLDVREFGSIRPSEDEIEEGKLALMEYFNALATLPSHMRFMRAKEENRHKLRETVEAGDPEPMLVDNILFRPIAQSALAEAMGEILSESETPKNQYKQKLDSIVKELSKRELEGMLQLRNRKSPWFGVLCDAVDENMRRGGKYQNLCQKMFVYLLHGKNDEENAALRKEFADARVTDPDNNKGIASNGDTVPLDEIQLPNPWR